MEYPEEIRGRCMLWRWSLSGLLALFSGGAAAQSDALGAGAQCRSRRTPAERTHSGVEVHRHQILPNVLAGYLTRWDRKPRIVAGSSSA